MLKMMCPNCQEPIISVLLAEIDEISCQHCHEGVPVRNVLISARGMTINRDDLLNSFFRYKKLLAETVEERASMEEDAEVLASSKKSADQFIATLEELMAGARDNFRLNFSLSVPVRLSFDCKIQSGWLANLSMVGACIEIDNSYFLPGIGSIVSLEFSLPGQQVRCTLEGMISWVREANGDKGISHDVGVKFIKITDKTREKLWLLISAAVHDVMAE